MGVFWGVLCECCVDFWGIIGVFLRYFGGGVVGGIEYFWVGVC